MAGVQPLSLIAQFDDLVRCRSSLTAGIETGMLVFFSLFFATEPFAAILFAHRTHVISQKFF